MKLSKESIHEKLAGTTPTTSPYSPAPAQNNLLSEHHTVGTCRNHRDKQQLCSLRHSPAGASACLVTAIPEPLQVAEVAQNEVDISPSPRPSGASWKATKEQSSKLTCDK